MDGWIGWGWMGLDGGGDGVEDVGGWNGIPYTRDGGGMG